MLKLHQYRDMYPRPAGVFKLLTSAVGLILNRLPRLRDEWMLASVCFIEMCRSSCKRLPPFTPNCFQLFPPLLNQKHLFTYISYGFLKKMNVFCTRTCKQSWVCLYLVRAFLLPNHGVICTFFRAGVMAATLLFSPQRSSSYSQERKLWVIPRGVLEVWLPQLWISLSVWIHETSWSDPDLILISVDVEPSIIFLAECTLLTFFTSVHILEDCRMSSIELTRLQTTHKFRPSRFSSAFCVCLMIKTSICEVRIWSCTEPQTFRHNNK